MPVALCTLDLQSTRRLLEREHSDHSAPAPRKLFCAMGKGGGNCSSGETERLQEEERKKRAQKERNEKDRAEERAEQERIANLPRMSVNFISPPPATKFEFHVEETVDGALKTAAPHYGVHEAATGCQ